MKYGERGEEHVSLWWCVLERYEAVGGLLDMCFGFFCFFGFLYLGFSCFGFFLFWVFWVIECARIFADKFLGSLLKLHIAKWVLVRAYCM